MAKSNKERQKIFREKMKGEFKNLRVYLDHTTYAKLDFIHYCEKATKQDVITQLISEKYDEWENSLCERAENAGKDSKEVKQYLADYIDKKLKSY